MAKERLKSPRARLFTALDLPDFVRDGLAAWQSAELRDEALRPVRPEALHVTLCFLGHLPERAIDRIAAVVAGLRARPVPLRLLAAPVGIPAGRPRLLALDAPGEEALALESELSAALRAQRLYEPERRPFWPHVTVARVRPQPGRGSRPRRVEDAPGPLPEGLLEPFGAVRAALYRSHLRRSGAEYVRLAELDLPPIEAARRGDEEDG